MAEVSTTTKGPDVADLNPQLRDSLNQLVAAVKAQGGNPTITSGYRTAADQQYILDHPETHGSNPVAPVGSSLHEKGLAADVVGDAKTTKLLHDLAPQFGLAFPHSNDPVHVQLAGGDNATGTAPTSGQPMPLKDRLEALAGMFGAVTPAASAVSEASSSVAAPSSGVTEAPTGAATDTQPATQQQDASGTTAPTAGPLTDQTAQANQALGKQIAAKYGWSDGASWDALNTLITSESSWIDQKNQAGGSAAGIGQNIHGYGAGYEQGNVAQQIEWTLNYIKNRYGDPQKAWQHKLNTRGDQGNAGGWY